MELKTKKTETPVFKVKDFDGAGQYIVRGSKKYDFEVFTDGGRASTFIYKIGYSHEVRRDKEGKNIKEGKYFVISIADGWSWRVGTKEELVEHLNNNPNGDKYRWATEEELILIIKAQTWRVLG